VFSNPSWKVIVSASRGQYLKPGSSEPGFFSCEFPFLANFLAKATSLPATNAKRLRKGAQATKQSNLLPALWIASRSLSSGAHSRDPFARNDGAMDLLQRDYCALTESGSPIIIAT
jgi:hypothetical protein